MKSTLETIKLKKVFIKLKTQILIAFFSDSRRDELLKCRGLSNFDNFSSINQFTKIPFTSGDFRSTFTRAMTFLYLLKEPGEV